MCNLLCGSISHGEKLRIWKPRVGLVNLSGIPAGGIFRVAEYFLKAEKYFRTARGEISEVIFAGGLNNFLV